MSEAYECDRCATLKSGSPFMAVQVSEGFPRRRCGDTAAGHETPIPGDPVIDLCQACHNDLARWFVEGGGDRDRVLLKDYGAEE